MSASNRAVQLAWPSAITHPVLVTFEVATSALTLLALRLFEEQDQPLRIMRLPHSSESMVYLVTDERAYRRCRVLGREVRAHTERANLGSAKTGATTPKLLEQQTELLTLADLAVEVRPAALPSLSSPRAAATDSAKHTSFVVVDTPDAACARRMQAFGYRARIYPCATTCLSYIRAPTAFLTSLDAGWQAHEVQGPPHGHLPTEFLTLVGPEREEVLTYSYHKSHAFFSIISWHELEDSLVRCEEPGHTPCTVQAVWAAAVDIGEGSAWRERTQHPVEDRWAIDQFDQLHVGAPDVRATAHVVAWRRLADHEPAAGVAAANRRRLHALSTYPHPHAQQADAGIPGPAGPAHRDSDERGEHGSDHRGAAALAGDAATEGAAGTGRADPPHPPDPPDQSDLATSSSTRQPTSAAGALLALPARPFHLSGAPRTPNQPTSRRQSGTHASSTIQDSQQRRTALEHEQALVDELAAALEERALALSQGQLPMPPVIDWLVEWLVAHNALAIRDTGEPKPESDLPDLPEPPLLPERIVLQFAGEAQRAANDKTSSAASAKGDDDPDGGTYVIVGVEDLVDRLWYAAFRDEDFRRREGIRDWLVPWLLRWPSSEPVQPRRLYNWEDAKPDEVETPPPEGGRC
jgi:hypothetical protein